MGQTWEKVNKQLGEAGIVTDPAILNVQVFGGQADVPDRQVIVLLLKFVSGLVAITETLANEIDDLRATVDRGYDNSDSP